MCWLQSLSTPADATAQSIVAAGEAGMASLCGSSHPAALWLGRGKMPPAP